MKFCWYICVLLSSKEVERNFVQLTIFVCHEKKFKYFKIVFLVFPINFTRNSVGGLALGRLQKATEYTAHHEQT